MEEPHVLPELLAALNATVMLARSRAKGVPVVGVAGPQGSGKTTLVRAWARTHPRVAAFSLDDVYLSAAARRGIAERVHPLFATRGPPSTHDLDLFSQTLSGLLEGRPTPIPSFDKVVDEPRDRASWPVFPGDADLVLVDGWCLGATAEDDESLIEPINALEAQEDRLGRWRSHANSCLEGPYAQLFARFDAMLYLRAPSFEVIESWRGQQEEGLLGRPLAEDDRRRIARFIAHFERITRHMLVGGQAADVVAQLDEARNVMAVGRVQA